MPLKKSSILAAVLIIQIALLAGCSGESHDKYITDTSKARRALEAALTAWQSGAPQATVKSLETPIDPFDARWRDGKKLERFEILKEEPPNPHPAFVVKLRLADALEDEEAMYYVMGIDPILVFRKEDYQRASGM